ncbi:MAG: DUF4177 domain-containing protein [Pseudomonadota bacterium]
MAAAPSGQGPAEQGPVARQRLATGHGSHVYRVEIYREGMISSLILGAAKLNAARFTDFLNEFAQKGWRVVSLEKDTRRMLLFFTREAYVVVFERPVSGSTSGSAIGASANQALGPGSGPASGGG